MTFTRCPVVIRTNPNASSITPTGKFDRATIMRKAVAMARQSRSTGLSWRVLMRDCLRLAWSRAREDMRVHALVEPIAPAASPQPLSPPRSRFAPCSVRFTAGRSR